MHNRTVICLYQLDPSVGLGFSHAYFPSESFDEYAIDGAWAFDGATVRFSREIATAPPDKPMPLVLRVK